MFSIDLLHYSDWWCEPHCYFYKANLLAVGTAAVMEAACDAECWEFFFGKYGAQKYDSLEAM